MEQSRSLLPPRKHTAGTSGKLRGFSPPPQTTHVLASPVTDNSHDIQHVSELVLPPLPVIRVHWPNRKCVEPTCAAAAVMFQAHFIVMHMIC